MTPSGRRAMTFYHHTTMQRANDLLLYGFPSGADGVDVLLSRDATPANGEVVVEVSLADDISWLTWHFARLRSGVEGSAMRVPSGLLKDALLTVLERADVLGKD